MTYTPNRTEPEEHDMDCAWWYEEPCDCQEPEGGNGWYVEDPQVYQDWKEAHFGEPKE